MYSTWLIEATGIFPDMLQNLWQAEFLFTIIIISSTTHAEFWLPSTASSILLYVMLFSTTFLFTFS
jgi:hypothetical protein